MVTPVPIERSRARAILVLTRALRVLDCVFRVLIFLGSGLLLLAIFGLLFAYQPFILLIGGFGFFLWLAARSCDERMRKTDATRQATLRELQAIRARLDALAVLAPPPPPPPPSYRWDYRTGEWRPMDESDAS